MRIILISLALLTLLGCDKNSELDAIKNSLSTEKVWVFTQINVREEADGIDSYYYYGKVSKATYQAISENRLTQGFLLLEEVKYWGNDDLINEYRDYENSGQLVFRIQDIQKIDLINVEPIAGKGIEQFRDSSPQTSVAVGGNAASNPQKPEATR